MHTLKMISRLVVLICLFNVCCCLRSVCYYTNWSQYRPESGKYVPEDVDPTLCTHIIYSFGKISNLEILPFEWNDDPIYNSEGMYARMMQVRSESPDTKVLLAVGGWNLGTEPFTQIAASSQSRATFAMNAIKFLRERDFDGLDIDWEYPGSRGSPASDKTNFVLLMTELRRAFENEASQENKNRLLLSGAFPAGKTTVDDGYNLPALVPSLDFINLMSYDFHGGWENQVGHNAPLYKHTQDQWYGAYLNVDWAVQYYLDQGVPASLLNLGIPTYGRSFTLSNPANHEIGSSASGVGTSGTFTRESGMLSYYEVCAVVQSGAQMYNIPSQHARYLVSGNQWVGFDDVDMVKEKACYAKQRGLGGIMFWALDFDDFSGTMCNQGKYPLISAAFQELQSSSTSCQVSYSQQGNINPETTAQPSVVQPAAKSSTIELTDVCDSGIDYMRDPTDCSRYYRCVYGEPVGHDCPSGLLFNDQSFVCDWPENVPEC